MALAGSVAVGATSQNDLVFSWAASQDTVGNASTVAWKLELVAYDYGRIVATPGSGWQVTIDGQSYAGTTDIAIGNNERKTLASGQVKLSHDQNGEKSFAFSFLQEFYITFGSNYIRTAQGSGEAVLDPIPRASVPTLPVTEAVLGQEIRIETNRAAESFTHTLLYSFGTCSGTIGEGVADSAAWTPPISLASGIPNAASGTAVITCVTYENGSQVGDAQQVSLVLTVPESIVPTVSASWEDTSGAYEALGTLVQGISRLDVSVTAGALYGSTVTETALSLGGKAYSGGILTEAGDMTLTVTATDSRGRRASREYPLTVAAYVPPALTLTASRCQEDGTADDTGEFAAVTMTGHVTALEGNTPGLTLSYAAVTEEIAVEAGDIAVRKIIPADSNQTLTVSSSLFDTLCICTREMVLSTGYATLDLLSGGRGIAFGTTATRPGFECAMKAYFTGGIEGAEAEGTAQETVSAHDSDEAAHGGMKATLASIQADILGKSQLQPAYAETIADCTDQTKVYLLPDGYLYAYRYAHSDKPPIEYTYVSGGFYNLSGGWTGGEGLNTLHTGLIPVTPGDQFSYVGRAQYETASVLWFDETGAFLLAEQYYNEESGEAVTVTAPEKAASVRFASFDYDDSPYLDVQWLLCQASILGWQWVSTGHAFVPADYESRILALEGSGGAQDEAIAALGTRLDSLEESIGAEPEITVTGKDGGYWSIQGLWTEMAGVCAKGTNLVKVSAGDKFSYTGIGIYDTASVLWYGKSGDLLSYAQYSADGGVTTVEVTAPAGAASAMFCSFQYADSYEAVVLNVVAITERTELQWLKNANPLWGKTYCACGDSFTAGDFAEKTDDTWDEDTGLWKAYPWHIAQRNRMTVYNEAVSGSTMHDDGSGNAYCVERCRNLSKTVDYITLCFGLNEVEADLGTEDSTDTATVRGAWNTALEVLLTDHPYAKIGIIIPDGWCTEEMRSALVGVAQRWGIPWLDLNEGALTVGRRTGVCDRAIELRNAAFSENDHPNPQAHAFRSTIIENFLRSL